MKKLTELRLQSDCFLWHYNTYPEERKRLFMVHNTPRHKVDGAGLRAAGMIAGVADLQYLRLNRPPLFIEMKLPKQKQKPKQIIWQAVAEATGAIYVVCDNLEDFKALIEEYRKN